MKILDEALVLDIGNTRIKLAHVSNGEISEVLFFQNNELQSFKKYIKAFRNLPAIAASVREEKFSLWLKNLLPNVVFFSINLPLPIKVDYETPETLGVDRLANAICANSFVKNPALIIDLGTCVKYDLVVDNVYLGGAISPGLQMRFKAMHQQTGKLPLISVMEGEVLGKSTKEAMTSGVIHGIHFEIQGYIEFYRSKYPDLTIFITGGDRIYFDFPTINNIFARQNMTLQGLLTTLSYVQSQAK